MSDFTVYTDDADRVRRLMQAYLTNVKADYIMLVHRDGSVISEVGSIGMDDSSCCFEYRFIWQCPSDRSYARRRGIQVGFLYG